MKRFMSLVLIALSLVAVCETSSARADWGSLHYGGYQPWWNIFAKRHRNMTVEEERLQRFWHDYYDALRRYYGMLDRIDWVAYYKNHGYQINSGCGGPGGRSTQFAPVIVTPGMQWAVPNTSMGGPQCGPGMGMGMGGAPMSMGYGMMSGNPYMMGMGGPQ